MPINQKTNSVVIQAAIQNTAFNLREANVQTLCEGIELLNILDAAQYQKGFKPVFQSTIGAHFRHILEHYRCFLKQLAGGTFCYDDRARDQLLEHDHAYALSTINEIVSSINNLKPELFTGSYHITDQISGAEVATTLARELLFLQSHTVHHYAIIGAMARNLGEQPMSDFGVAIATRNYLVKQSQIATAEQVPDGQGICETVEANNFTDNYNDDEAAGEATEKGNRTCVQ